MAIAVPPSLEPGAYPYAFVGEIGQTRFTHTIKTDGTLGKPDDPACWHAGRNIVDHCLKVAFNPQYGYLNEDGTVDGTGTMGANMEWWVEAESLNGLLLMHKRYGKDDPKYWNAFVKQWDFIQNHFIDHTNGGWYKGVSTSLVATRGNKSDPWTEGYPQGRAMLNVTERLRKLAGEK